MFDFLKYHPFAVEAFFESSTVLTFAVPKDLLLSLIPSCLELDTFKDEYGFIAVAMVQACDLRPKGFPKFLGNDFFLIGYRIFVRYTDKRGKRLRGLYILKSETDSKRMEFFGNFFTKYKYTTTDINRTVSEGIIEVSSKYSDFAFKMDRNSQDVKLPEGSPFGNWSEARRFAGPLPFTFSYNEIDKKILIIEGVREDWNPKPLIVLDYHFAFIESFDLNSVVFANAFII